MRNFLELISDLLTNARELMPWDFARRRAANPDLLIVDVREPAEFDAMHIAGSLNVPRGILESACKWEYEETVPELVTAREREIVVGGALTADPRLPQRSVAEDRDSRQKGLRAAPGRQARQSSPS